MDFLFIVFFETKRSTPKGVLLRVMLYHCRFLNPRLKNVMCKSEFYVLF